VCRSCARSRRADATSFLLALAVIAVAAPARAHLGHVVQRAERYLKIEGSAEGVRIVVSLTLGPDEAIRVLDAADADGDGTVTQPEADDYMRSWAEGLGTELPIELDGEPVRVEWAEPFLDPVGPIRPLPASVELVTRVPAAEGVHVVTVRDRMRAETFDRTDVSFRVRDGARLLRSGPGDRPTESVRQLAYGPAGTRNYVDVLTAELELPAASDPTDSRPRTPWWIGAVAAVVLGLVLIAVRGGRRPKTARRE
jgi:hypothetical protein